MKVLNQLIWVNYCYVGSKTWFRYWERLVICFCHSLSVDWLPQISSCLTHELGYEINVPICWTFLVYLVFLSFFIIRNFSTFFIPFNFSVFLLYLGILILLSCIQTNPFLCLLHIFFAIKFVHLGGLLVCWVLRIGECKSNLYELNQTANLKRSVQPSLKMFLVEFSSFTDRRVKDRSHNCYFRTFESRDIKLEINFDLLSL